jgi:hypothetical protein
VRSSGISMIHSGLADGASGPSSDGAQAGTVQALSPRISVIADRYLP